MDSGLGSDEDRRNRRRGRTKEQKQLRNQQLVINAGGGTSDSCFITTHLSDGGHECCEEAEDVEKQKLELFQEKNLLGVAPPSTSSTSATDTPYNSIDGPSTSNNAPVVRNPCGFFVDLKDVENSSETGTARTPPPSSGTNESAKTKNIFSMVIDFEAAKKEKPRQLGSFSASRRCRDGSISSSSMSSMGSLPPPPPTQNITECQQYVKLSDLKCQKASSNIVNVTQTPPSTCASGSEGATALMSKSIPETSWIEGPLALMSRSAGYRSTPNPIELEVEAPPPPPSPLGQGKHVLESSSASSRTASDCKPSNSVLHSQQRLGTDLLRMFLEEISPDVVVAVEGRRIKAHKCILASRCQYFAALLSGNWLESCANNVISMPGFSYEVVYFALCHIYSGAAHIPDSINVVELAAIADHLGLEGLKEVVEMALLQRYCHGFQHVPPCASCSIGLLEVLPLAAAYSLDDLYKRCLQWCTEHFVRLWPTRMFAALPRDLRDKCYQQHVINLSAAKVLNTQLACDRILATLPLAKWAEPVSQLVQQLADACHLYVRQHFAAVLNVLGGGATTTITTSSSTVSIIATESAQIDAKLLAAAKTLAIDQACKAYARCWRLQQANQLDDANRSILVKVQRQLEQCLVCQADRLIRSNAWLRLDSVLRTRIKNLTPVSEPGSRLPRRKAVTGPLAASTTSSGTLLISSSDSSRNSSPGQHQQTLRNQQKFHTSRSSSDSLPVRRITASTTRLKSSTLTLPTASSAAKCTASAPNRVATGTIAATVRTSSAPNARQPINCKTEAPRKRFSTPSSGGGCGGGSSRVLSKSAIQLTHSSSTTNNSKNMKTAAVNRSNRFPASNRSDNNRKTPVDKTKLKTKPIVTRSSTMNNEDCDSETQVKCTSSAMQRSNTFLVEDPLILAKV